MRVRTYGFPAVLRGQPEPRLATTPTNRPRRSLSSPGCLIQCRGPRPTVEGVSQVEWIPPQPAPAPAGSPAPAPAPPRAGLKRLTGPLMVVGALLAKGKGVLLLPPKLKLATTSPSMLVSR